MNKPKCCGVFVLEHGDEPHGHGSRASSAGDALRAPPLCHAETEAGGGGAGEAAPHPGRDGEREGEAGGGGEAAQTSGGGKTPVREQCGVWEKKKVFYIYLYILKKGLFVWYRIRKRKECTKEG